MKSQIDSFTTSFLGPFVGGPLNYRVINIIRRHKFELFIERVIYVNNDTSVIIVFSKKVPQPLIDDLKKNRWLGYHTPDAIAVWSVDIRKIGMKWHEIVIDTVKDFFCIN